MVNIFTILFCSFFLFLAIRKILSGFYSILHVCSIIFFAMQVLPLFVGILWENDSIHNLSSNMYRANIDVEVHYIYCLFCCLTMILLFALTRLTNSKENIQSFVLSKSNYTVYVNIFLLVGIFSPLLVWIMSPNPSIYFQFARFHRQDEGFLNSLDAAYVYHTIVMFKANCISFMSTLLFYGINKKNVAANVVVLLGIILFSWLDGKRAFLVFALVAIVVIDVVQRRYLFEKYKLVIKSCCFLFVSVLFFIIYKEISGKGAEADFFSNYQQYFSRMVCVKTSIYSILSNQPMVEYPGQSLLYDFFFFVPRFLWPDKPVMFCKYFTAFAYNRDVAEFLSWNLHVNIWTEYIANLGALGYFFALTLITCVAKISDASTNMFLKFLGMLFVSLYFMFGFEWLVLVIYSFFVLAFVYNKIKSFASGKKYV